MAEAKLIKKTERADPTSENGRMHYLASERMAMTLIHFKSMLLCSVGELIHAETVR